jgi:hypothetical protein
MKKTIALRGYYHRAKMFGYIVIFVTLFSILYFLDQFLHVL